MNHTIGKGGIFALMVAHCAGMVDLVALPVWIGALVQDFGRDPQQAGGIVTLFLLGAVVASIGIARQLAEVNGRFCAALGYGLAAIAFLAMPATQNISWIAALHFGAGLSAGAALSVTHGTIGRAGNPHRLFALAGMALGVFAIGFLGFAAPLVSEAGGAALFRLFAGVMATASCLSLVAFPALHKPSSGTTLGAPAIPAAAWYGVAGISLMALVQAMVFSFLERAGHARGFSVAQITSVLIAVGVVNLFPAAAAALLERRLHPSSVLLAGPIVQAGVAATLMGTAGFGAYAAAAAVFSAVMIFTHTFAFGVIGRRDRGGRAVAATPAMLMTGAAIGPVLGGTLVKHVGFWSLGIAAAVLACVSFACFLLAQRPDPMPASNLEPTV
ncbi:MFS transporter [Roseateles sp. SL47]|uniref:MFS transporter n=1 Tax=Roseateles sp. SL47 TaxID=2995138 RepID=UPI00226E02A1|nr:MFS transporter [Roseateles sp. SL47]WAC70833.1 MFS transporter [Roseateles sp. SL47]